tara:strand:+ start:10382 stop:10564 length:183 start_codon:yes stop_codon:yes gene_type:complete
MNKQTKMYLLLLDKRKMYQNIILITESNKTNNLNQRDYELLVDKYKSKVELLNELINELA